MLVYCDFFYFVVKLFVCGLLMFDLAVLFCFVFAVWFVVMFADLCCVVFTAY